MANSEVKYSRDEFYEGNNDFSGSRTFISQDEESVEFRNSSNMRVWYNDINTSFEKHCHSAIEIILPLENNYEVTIDGQDYVVGPKEIMLIPSRSLHEIKAPEKGIRFIYLFDFSFMDKMHGFTTINTILSKPAHIKPDSLIYQEVFLLLNQIRNEYFSQNEFSDFTISGLILQFMAKLGNNQKRNFVSTEKISSAYQKEYAQKFNDVLLYIDTHYQEDIDQEVVAAKIGFSKYHFSRLFKQYTNYTFCEYINYRRISVSENLLTNKSIPITDICMLSGFNSISTFNRVFHNAHNCSPSEYRELHTTQNF